jgi:hypothetical protein
LDGELCEEFIVVEAAPLFQLLEVLPYAGEGPLLALEEGDVDVVLGLLVFLGRVLVPVVFDPVVQPPDQFVALAPQDLLELRGHLIKAHD